MLHSFLEVYSSTLCTSNFFIYKITQLYRICWGNRPDNRKVPLVKEIGKLSRPAPAADKRSGDGDLVNEVTRLGSGARAADHPAEVTSE